MNRGWHRLAPLLTLAGCTESNPYLDDAVGPDPTTTTAAESGTESAPTSTPPDSSTQASESSATSTPADTTATDPGCRQDAECSAPTPHCVSGECTTCSATDDPDGACAALDPDFPLCERDRCVQCRGGEATVCTGTVPVCDVDTSTCIGCTDHDQCPASACHLGEGSCLPEDRVWYVDGDASSCASADGSEGSPFCTLGEAIDGIGQASRGTVRIAVTATPYTEAIVIDGNRTVALLADGDGVPALDAQGAPSLEVDGATVFARRLRWRSNAGDPALLLTDATTWIDRCEIVQNQGGGIDASMGTELHLRSSIIGAGGTGLADRQALLADASTFDIVASTIAGNDGSGIASIRCLGGGGGTVRSSIVVGLDPPSVSCLGLEVDDSAIDTAGLVGAGNMVIDALNPGWFVDAAGGDFHLVAGTLFEGLGRWRTGDPAVDIDGDPRPARDGVADVAGADVP